MFEQVKALELVESFLNGNLDKPSQNILQTCSKLCVKYQLSSDELVNQVDSFLCNSKSKDLNQSNIQGFEKYLESDFKKKNRISQTKEKSASKTQNSKPNFSTPATKRKLEYKTPVVTPLVPVIEYDLSSVVTPASMSKESATFETRVNAGEIVPGTEYNKSLSFRGEFSPSQSENFNSLGLRSKFWVQYDDFENVKQRYRFMYTSLEERARAADKQFLKMKTALCKTSQISIDDVHFVGESSQSMMWVCGRICAESGAQKINPTSLLLEGERESGGRRVILDISELPTYSLFPGQIILVEGINSTGKKIVAKRIIDDAHCPFPTTPIEDIFEYQYSLNYQGGSGLHIVAAAGPFTTSDNLMYQPLQQLLAMCLHQTKPDVLILIGPFVDVNHPQLATGDIKLYDDDGSSHDASYEMVFVERIIRDLLNALENDTDNKLPAHIVLIPSLNDAHHEYVFPQPPFGQRDLIPNKFFEEAIGEFKLNDPNKRIHFMPNPCMFRINEVLIGVTSLDILHALSAEEISHGRSDNRLARLMGHVVSQQSFIPMNLPSTHNSAQVDYRQTNHFNIKTSPDILITPSKLTPLVKENSGMLLINPGHLAKGTAGGTYVELTVHPFPKDYLEKEIEKDKSVEIPHSIVSRTKACVVRI